MSAFSDFMANLDRIRQHPTMGDLPVIGGIIRGQSQNLAQTPIFQNQTQVNAMPVIGGAMNLGSQALVGAPLAAMEAQLQGANKAIQGADATSSSLTALMMVVAKGGRLKTALRDPNYVMTPDDINTAQAMAALEQGHLMRAQEIFQSGPDSTTSYVAGAGRLLLNPLNFSGAAGAALRAPRAIGLAAEAARGAGVAGEAARGIGLARNVARGAGALGDALVATDRFMALPFTAAGGALRQLPSGVTRTLGGATAGAVTGAGISKLSGDDQGLRDAMIGAGLGAGGVAGSSAFAKYLATKAPEIPPALAADAAPAIATADQTVLRALPAPDLPSAIPSYEPLPRPARLPAAPNFPRPTGEPLPPLPPRVEPVMPPPPPLARPEPPAVTPTVLEPAVATPAAPTNALSVGERGALLDRVTSGEFGPISQVLDALHQANYGKNVAFGLKGIYGTARGVPADALRNHLDYMLAKAMEDPVRRASLVQRAPRLAREFLLQPGPVVGAENLQQALRATLGRPLKGKLPKGAVLPTTERPVDEVAADILRATQQGDKSALDGYLNEYRALQQPKPELATPPPADIPPPTSPEPVAAPSSELPAPSPEETLYQQAVGLLHGGDPQFNSPYVPGPTYFTRRLPIDQATANSIVQRLVKDPAIVEVAPTGEAMLRSAMNPRYRGRPAPDVPLAPVTSAEAVIQPGQYPASDFRSWFYQMPEPTGMTSDAFEQAYSQAKDLVRASGSDTLPYSGTLQQGLGVDSNTAVALFRRLARDRAVTSGGSNRAREALLAPEFLASRAPAAPSQPTTLTPVQQAAADARNRLFGDPAADDLGLNVGAALTSPLGKRAAAGALAGGLSTYGDPNVTPEDLLMRGLVGAGVGASAPMALRGATRLARQLVPDAPKAWQDLTANILLDLNRVKGVPSHVNELRQDVMLSLQDMVEKGTANFKGGDVPLYKFPAASQKQWRSQIVSTLRNLWQDTLTTLGKFALFGKQDGVSIADNYAARASYRKNFRETDPFKRNIDVVQELLTDYGQQDYEVGKKLGMSLIDESTQATGLGPLQRGIVGAGFSLANPITGLVPVTSIAYGAARGVADPFFSAFFNTLNGFTYNPARQIWFARVGARRAQEAAAAFLTDIAAQGVDTTALTTRGLKFTPSDVEQAALASGIMPDAAAALAAQWDTAIKGALDKGAERARTVFGDMNALGGLGRSLSGVAPFASWPISQAKITAELLGKYPGPAAVTAGAMRRNEEQLQARGEPRYYAASVAIPTDLPVLGGLARARLGGEQGTVYLNPASLLVPGTDPLTVSTPTAKDQQKTAYQRARDLLGLAGLSFGPPAQAAAYATGQDYRRPGALSRTAGLEAAALGPAVGDWPVQALDATRKLLVPALAKAGVPTGSASTPPDPIQKEIATLVWQRKQKVLGDAGTEQDLRDSLNPNSALYQEALMRVKNRAVLGNAVSVTSPITISAAPAVTSELYQAKAQTPYDYNALKTMETFAKRAPDAAFTPEERQQVQTAAQQIMGLRPDVAQQAPTSLLATMVVQTMQNRNAVYQSATPSSRVLGMAATKPRTDALLRQWDYDHAWLSVYFPVDFKKRRAEYKKTLAAP